MNNMENDVAFIKINKNTIEDDMKKYRNALKEVLTIDVDNLNDFEVLYYIMELRKLLE